MKTLIFKDYLNNHSQVIDNVVKYQILICIQKMR